MVSNDLNGLKVDYVILDQIEENNTVTRGTAISFDSVVDSAIFDISEDSAAFWVARSVRKTPDLNEVDFDSHSSIVEDDDMESVDLCDLLLKTQSCFKKEVSFFTDAIEISPLGDMTYVSISDEKKRVKTLPFLSRYEDIIFAFMQRVEQFVKARLDGAGVQPSHEGLLVMKQIREDMQILFQRYKNSCDFKERGKEDVRYLLSNTVRAFAIQELELDRELLRLFASNPAIARNLWYCSEFQRAVRKEKNISILESAGLACHNYTNTLARMKFKDVRLAVWEVDLLLEAIAHACDEFFLIY